MPIYCKNSILPKELGGRFFNLPIIAMSSKGTGKNNILLILNETLQHILQDLINMKMQDIFSLIVGGIFFNLPINAMSSKGTGKNNI